MFPALSIYNRANHAFGAIAFFSKTTHGHTVVVKMPYRFYFICIELMSFSSACFDFVRKLLIYNRSDNPQRNIETLSEHGSGNDSRRVKLAYLFDLGFGKAAYSMWKLLPIGSSFIYAISNILKLCSGIKMLRSNARWIIAKVNYRRGITCQWSTMQDPRNPMGQFGTHARRSSPDRSISTFKYLSGPYPAFTKLWTVFWNRSVFVYFGPEPIWKCFAKTLRGEILGRNVWLHNKFVLLCRALGCSFTARAFSFSLISNQFARI